MKRTLISLMVILGSYSLLLPNAVHSFVINSSSTLNPLKFEETINNDFYPFMYEVPPILSYIYTNETLKKSNFSIGNPYAYEDQVVVGDTAFWTVRYCGVHFLNKGEGYILSHHPFDGTEDDPNSRCVWGFVGSRFCTPEVQCPKFQDQKGSCRTNYLQMTDGGESFAVHFCDDDSKPTKTYTAKNGVLDVIYRYSQPAKRPHFECWVKCVNYEANYTVTGSNAVGEDKLKVTFHEDTKAFESTIPAPQIQKDCNCGVSNGGANANRTYRIVGGRETLVSQYPWTLGILSKHGKLPYCGASLISSEYVLTAMHCVEDEDLEDIVIALNEHDFFNDTETVGNTVRRAVVEVIPYHYYMESTFYGDFALLRLEKPVNVNLPMFTPVCLPPSESQLFQGEQVIAAGWGTVSGGPFSSKSPKLLEVPLVVYSNVACNDYHGHTPPEPPQVEESMLCAGYSEGGRDTCAGDSGGPLIARMKDSGKFAQIGVTSWGFGCAIRLNPGVFTRISSFLYWIRMNTVDGHYCM